MAPDDNFKKICLEINVAITPISKPCYVFTGSELTDTYYRKQQQKKKIQEEKSY